MSTNEHLPFGVSFWLFSAIGYTILTRMSIFGYPVMITFVALALALLLLGLFWRKYAIFSYGVAIILISLFVINALLLNFGLLEIVVTLLIVLALFFITMLIKERRT